MSGEKFLRQVTVTGADESVDRSDLYELSHQFPFVEWGILLSQHNEGGPRFPTRDWYENFLLSKPPSVHASGHLCGTWVKDIVAGGRMFRDAMPLLALYSFNRFQLNFHAIPHQVIDSDRFRAALVALTDRKKQQIIFQWDGVNGRLYHHARCQTGRHLGLDAVALYDVSGGAGVLPSEWPEPMGDYCGYAGGLSPGNLPAQLVKIQERVTNRDGSLATIWIDAETHLRSNNNRQFNLGKVERFLEVAQPYVKAGAWSVHQA